jgi:hypothetical protein
MEGKQVSDNQAGHGEWFEDDVKQFEPPRLHSDGLKLYDSHLERFERS